MSLLRGFTLLLVLQLAGEVVVRLLGLSVPGPVVGLVLLLVGLIAWRPLAPAIEGAADTLLAHLSLLFVPAGVGVVVHLGRLDGVLVAVAVTLLGSTVIGLAVTALVLQTLLRRSGAVPIERVGADVDGGRGVGRGSGGGSRGGGQDGDGVDDRSRDGEGEDARRG